MDQDYELNTKYYIFTMQRNFMAITREVRNEYIS